MIFLQSKNHMAAKLFYGLLLSGLFCQQSAAKVIQPETPKSSLAALLDCTQITDSAERLACFDSQSTVVKSQLSTGELVPVYKAEIAEARRGLFGIDRIRMPGFMANEVEDISEIETTIVTATRQQSGWRFTLADGSQWDQIDTANPYFRNTEGTPVRIRRATLGSYLLTVGNSPAMRVSRRR